MQRIGIGILALVIAAMPDDSGIHSNTVWHASLGQLCVETMAYTGDRYQHSEVCLICPEIPPCPVVCGRAECAEEYPCPAIPQRECLSYRAQLTFQQCMLGPGRVVTPECAKLYDQDTTSKTSGDGDVDLRDLAE